VRIQAQAAGREFREIHARLIKARATQTLAHQRANTMKAQTRALEQQRSVFDQRRLAASTAVNEAEKAVVDLAGSASHENVLALRPRKHGEEASKQLVIYAKALSAYSHFANASFNLARIEGHIADLDETLARSRADAAARKNATQARHRVILITRHLDQHVRQAADVIKDGDGGLGDSLGADLARPLR
jgi:hypothetical protein